MMRRDTPKVAIPDSKQGHQNRNIAIERRLDEMSVDVLSAEQEFLEILFAYSDRKQKPN
jgi:hypothetical protein